MQQQGFPADVHDRLTESSGSGDRIRAGPIVSHYAAQFTRLAESRVTARKYAVSPLYRASRVFLHRLFLLRDTHTMLCPHDLFHSRIPIRRRSRLILVRSESQLVRSGTGDSRHTGPARRQACQIEETEPSAHFGFHR